MSRYQILFYVRTTRPQLEDLPTGKRPGGDCLGQQSSPFISPQLVAVATVKNNAVVTGKVGDVFVEIMLNTWSAVSLLRHGEAKTMNIRPSLQ